MKHSSKPQFLNKTTPPTLVTLVLLAGIGAMSMNVFLPSLPSMAEHFDVDYASMQLSITLYLAMTAVLQIIIGPLSDRYGRRPVILGALCVFCIATIGCLIAPNFETFLFCRITQGAVASALALSRAVVRDMVGTDKAASMIGYVTMGMALVPMLAPWLGGVLESLYGWKASFWLLLSCGFVIFWISYFDLRETHTNLGRGFSKQLNEYPILLTSPRFWGYALSAGCATGTYFVYLGGAPLIATHLYAMSPATLGLWFGAPAVGYMLGNGLSGKLAERYGIDTLVITGSLLAAGAFCMSALAVGVAPHSPIAFFAPVAIVGIGHGLIMPNATSGFLSVRPQVAGTASGLGSALMVGSGAAVSSLAPLVANETSTTPLPLTALMACLSFIGLTAALSVWMRKKRLSKS